MKTKICAAVLAMSGCVMMVFAAKVDPCTEKYTSCSNECVNAQASCKARGADPDQCERTYKMCTQACEKARKDCDGKAKKP
jgi:hypothetical protein